MSQEINLMYSVACGVSKGVIDKHFVYCLEENVFYSYENAVWKTLHPIELLSLISDNPAYSYINNHSITIRKQIIENLKLLIKKRLEFFNKSGFLNFDIGEFDPLTLKMYDHKKENYSTFRIPYPYDFNAKCPLWEKTLLEIFEKDLDKVSILQEFFGYCLTRDTRKEKALLLLGESRTGKSSILYVLNNLIGESNCSNVALKYISNPQYAPMLMNKLINIDTDVSGKAEKFEAEFKTITSGEPISVNQKYVPTFQFRPYCKLVMAANEFPHITDHSSAFYKRLILLPCNRVFEDIEQNLTLKDLLLEELPGIFNWTVEGLKRLNARGFFEQKDFMKEAVQELREESNYVEIFFRNHINVKVADGIYIEKGELYEIYKKWSQENGQNPLTAAKFSQAVFRKYSKVTPKNTHSKITGKRQWNNLVYIENKEILETLSPQQDIAWQD